MALEVFEEARRENNLIQRRHSITSAEHRFFMALLLNVPDRRRLLEIVGQRFSESDPVRTVLDWVEELAATKVWGGPEPNVLGINNLDDDYLFALECLLKGLTIDQTKRAFIDEFSPEYVASLSAKPEDLFGQIRNSSLFRTIFSPEIQASHDFLQAVSRK